MTSVFIFNQYYIDLLKRLKETSKAKKDDCKISKQVLKSIKENYITFDKNSDEYISYINSVISDESWKKYLENSVKWIEDNQDICLYKDISIESIGTVFDDKYLCTHFISVFYIFKQNISEETSTKIVKILQSSNITDESDLISELEDEDIKKILENLQKMRNEKIKDASGIDMKFIEDTTIGKLAKEILEDVDVSKLQKSMGENGDVLKAIGDPDSGFANIISSVSQKMASKISNGELKQENLVQDAMKFASIMPGMFGGGNGESGGSGRTKSKEPDMSAMMSMMASMMGKMGDGKNEMGNLGNMTELFEGMTNRANKPQKSGKGKGVPRTAVNENALKKLAQIKKMKKKLRQKSQTDKDIGSSE